MIRSIKVGPPHVLWATGILYGLGLLWLLPAQPLRFASDLLQFAVALSIMLGLPLLLLSRGYRITNRARRNTFRTIMSVILIVTMPWSCAFCLDYVTLTLKDSSKYKKVGLFEYNVATLHTKYGEVNAVLYGGLPNIVPDIRVYLDRPVIPGIVCRVLLAAVDSVYEAEIRPKGQDSIEINIPHWTSHGSDVHVVRRISP